MTTIERSRFDPPTDWSAAYDNRAAVGEAAVGAFVADITSKALAFRAERTAADRAELDLAYGDYPRQRFDLFLPEGNPSALAVFIHGGYWRTFDKSYWSHLAAGPLAHGAAVAMPSYTLCPETRISAITEEIARFLDKASARIEGPIRLAGHSAGGHLASCVLNRVATERIAKVVSISGLHDLRPLLRTSMNDDLRLDDAEARAESPIFHDPPAGIDLTCWVGADELPAFRLQNRLLAEIWSGLGARAEVVEAEGKDHFTVVEDLSDPKSALTASLMG
ncbi:MAG: alpha/beta hydrolase [Pseudomonadota bacterium]